MDTSYEYSDVKQGSERSVMLLKSITNMYKND